MGIKNLIKLVKKYSPDSITTKKISDFKNKTLGIDTNLMLYKNIFAIRRNGYDIMKNDKKITHIHSLLQKLYKFKEYNITPVFVFDSQMPKIKQETMKQRKEFRKVMKQKWEDAVSQDDKKKYYFMHSDITKNEIDESIELIKIFGYTVIFAKEEADGQLAELNIKGKIYAVITDDMDILLFGGIKMLKNFSVADKKNFQQINIKKLLKDLNINRRQLVDIGIAIGCDYCPDNYGIGPITAYKKLKNNEKLKLEDKYAYKKTVKYFMKPPVHDATTVKINKININFNKLTKFLKKANYTEDDIHEIIKKLI